MFGVVGGGRREEAEEGVGGGGGGGGGFVLHLTGFVKEVGTLSLLLGGWVGG